MSRLDRAIEYLAPVYGARRAEARAKIKALEIAQAYYDGADVGRRGASIRRSGASSDAISWRTLPRLRAGAHDLVRNNPHAKRGLEAIVSNTVGTGILPRFKRGRETVTELQQLARETLDTTAIDASGQHDYYGIQALAWNTTVESGESLVIRQWDLDADFPLQFLVLEPDYLDVTKDGPLRGGGRRVQGVEFDARGRRVRYWLYPEHPGSSRLTSLQSLPVSAADVAHIYRVDRPGQVRGIPWLAPVMLRVSDFDDYENAQLVRQKIAACFAVFYVDGAMGAQSQQPADTKEKIEPGMITRLSGAGSDVKFADPPQVTGFKDYAKVSLRAIAAGLGISYEMLSGDLEGANFVSGRMGWLEAQRNIDRWRWLTLIPQGCNMMTRWWLEAAELAGHDIDGVTVRHAPPRRAMIQPEREIPARVRARRAGLTTLTQQWQEDGLDPDEVIDELAEEQRWLDERGIVLDSDARKTSVAGLTQARGGDLSLPPTGEPGDDEDFDDD